MTPRHIRTGVLLGWAGRPAPSAPVDARRERRPRGPGCGGARTQVLTTWTANRPAVSEAQGELTDLRRSRHVSPLRHHVDATCHHCVITSMCHVAGAHDLRRSRVGRRRVDGQAAPLVVVVVAPLLLSLRCCCWGRCLEESCSCCCVSCCCCDSRCCCVSCCCCGRCLEEADALSLNGARVAATLLRLVPHPDHFRTALRAVKAWAAKRHLTCHALGLLGGIGKICSTYQDLIDTRQVCPAVPSDLGCQAGRCWWRACASSIRTPRRRPSSPGAIYALTYLKFSKSDLHRAAPSTLVSRCHLCSDLLEVQ